MKTNFLFSINKHLLGPRKQWNCFSLSHSVWNFMHLKRSDFYILMHNILYLKLKVIISFTLINKRENIERGTNKI